MPCADAWVWTAASSATRAWSGARWHTGSVAAASPVSAKAWQRQPPKSTSRRGQLAHGSFIHAVPRKALKAGEFAQISASACSRTFQKRDRGQFVPSRRRRMMANVGAERLLKIPAEPSPELRIPNAAAQTRVVSMAGIRLEPPKSTRLFKGIICDDISEFESSHASHAVRSLWLIYGPSKNARPYT